MTSSSKEINKLVGDAEKALMDLENKMESSSGYDIDYFPQGIVLTAFNALSALNKMLTPQVIVQLKGRSILNVMDKLGSKIDDPAIQTMLGKSAVEFSGIFHSVHKQLSKKDPSKVEGTLFSRLDK
jgi:hypothetical protein